jgi:16S rRNA U1498 N3-methylase RsmE
MQSRRCRLPRVRVVASLEQAVAGAANPVVRADFVDTPLPPVVGTVCIGPEGGWAPGEVTAVPLAAGLGATVLRSDTAAVVAATRLLAAVPSAT